MSPTLNIIHQFLSQSYKLSGFMVTYRKETNAPNQSKYSERYVGKESSVDFVRELESGLW